MKSPPVERTIRVLDFLTTHPGQVFSHADLSRRVGISKATAHSILTSLTAAGYLVRDPDTRLYSLGPAVIPVGTVAQQSLPAVARATDQAQLLFEELDVQCAVVWNSEEEIIILAHAGIPRVSGFSGQAGQRLPLVPPMGGAQMAWATEAQIEAWLARYPGQLSDEMRAHHLDILARCRRRGYAVGYSAEAYDRYSKLYQAPDAELHRNDVAAELRATLLALAHEGYPEPAEDTALRPRFISAPVFDHAGRTVLSLSLLLDDRFTAGDMPRLARQLMRATAAVTASINGRRPDVPVTASE
jgi:DNA-binding IclR family transcriptional regulator